MIIIVLVILFLIIFAVCNRVDDIVRVKSGRAVDSYDYIKYFKEDRSRVDCVERVLERKKEYKIKVTYTSDRKSVV